MPKVTLLVRGRAWIQSHSCLILKPHPSAQLLETVVTLRGYENGFLELRVSGVETFWWMIKLGWGHGNK